MQKILIATKNPGKLKEFKVLLGNLPIELVSLKDLNIDHNVEENGKTFDENAIKKACEYSKLSGIITISEDGGLEIDALNGEPGVHSRRWHGRRMTDKEMIDAVLEKMKDVPPEKRTAHMRGVLALAEPGKEIKTFEGKIDVVIAFKPSPKIIEGYPYRSIMYLPKKNKYFVDIPFSEQSNFSHRGMAIKKMKPYLEKIIGKQIY